MLKVGDKAPNFECLTQNEEMVTLDRYSGKKLILFFYPKDNTAGCSAAACDLSSNYEYWLSKGYSVVGVSPDSVASHKRFIDKKELKMDLISDEEKVMLTDYGVWGEKKMCGRTYMGVFRTTFVIDESGVIERIIKKVKTKEHTAQLKSEMELE